MRPILARLLLGSAILLSGCAGGAGGMAGPPAPAAGDGVAMLADASGAGRGVARFHPVAGGIEVRIAVTGLPPGPKGLHFHTVGRCEAPGFASAGGHWNPTAMKHGMASGMGPHLGDLPNIDIGADGTGTATLVLAGATLTGGVHPMLDADGTAIMIHAGPDDYKTDPSGNSGARIACGVVTRK